LGHRACPDIRTGSRRGARTPADSFQANTVRFLANYLDRLGFMRVCNVRRDSPNA
jgi:hypothetical protein